MIIEEQEELLKSEISNLIVESKANETNKALDKDEVVITEGNQAGPIDEIIIVKDTAEEETKKKSSPPASIYSR